MVPSPGGWAAVVPNLPSFVRRSRPSRTAYPDYLRISPGPPARGRAEEGVYDFVMTCASQGALEVYVEPYLPRPVLLVIGETPGAQALTGSGTQLDFHVGQ